MILLGGLVAGLAVSPTYGQSGEEYVLDIDIRVKAEASPGEMQVRLIRRGDVLTEKTTNERGVVDFSGLEQGTYTVEVPQRNFQETVEVRSVTEVMTVPRPAPAPSGAGATGGGGQTTTDTRWDMRHLLYGILLVLLAAAGGLGYLLLREAEGWTLSSQAATQSTSTETNRSSSVGERGARRTQHENEHPESMGNRGTAAGNASAAGQRDEHEAEERQSTPPGDHREREPSTVGNASSQERDSEGLEGGDYRTRKKIGSGGMSTVWLAEDSADRNVALKVMNENMLDDEDLVRKFIQEGKALERINSTHPAAPVVQVYDFGHPDGDKQPYLALEYLEGRSLEEVIDPEDPLSVDQALPVIKQIAIALSAAHANGVYHRDVKPENVIIVDRSSVLNIRLIDFGVARHDYLSYVTMDGSLMGTPPYMSPEQGTGGEIDERSDIYALGALAYALLAGEPPFVDDNPLTVLEMHQEASVPPLPDRVPSSVADLIRWMLEKEPEERPSQMWQVVGRIDELIVSIPDQS